MGTVRIACLQLRARELEDSAEALEDALAAIDLAAGEGGQILVLPEMTYPAYFLRSRAAYRNEAGSENTVLAAFSARARQHGVVLAAGMGITVGEHLYNTAVLFGPDGEEIGRYYKSFLWHFDRAWFSPGSSYPVFDTPFGRVGMLICADGRVPEIARSLALRGAQLILDPTAWVTGGRQAETLTSPQVEYMMPVRALENGVPVAAANKWGVEARTIAYCGRSRIIDAQGRTVAAGPSEGDCCVVAEVELPEPAAPVPRRPELYADIVRPADELPVRRLLGERPVMDGGASRVVVVQMKRPGSAAEFLGTARAVALAAAGQDARLVLFPDTCSLLDEHALEALNDLSLDTREATLGFTIRVGEAGHRRRQFRLLSAGTTILRYDQAHLQPPDVAGGFVAGDGLSPVVRTPAGRLAVMLGAEGLVPEVARCLMLQGAELLLWPAGGSAHDLLTVARSRADENRVYVALAAYPEPAAGAALVAPDGTVLAAAPLEVEAAPGGPVHPALARWKEMAPGTHVLHSRFPESYGALLKG